MKKPKNDTSPLRAEVVRGRLYLIRPEKLKEFRDILNKKKYRVADTDLTYRQINSLDGNNILQDNRKEKRGWRKFSYKELIFISIIKELRAYGFIDERLENLRDLFFKKSNLHDSDLAIISAYSGTKTTLVIIMEDGGFTYDLVGFEIKPSENRRSYISVNINKVIEELKKTTDELNINMDEMLTNSKNGSNINKNNQFKIK